MRVQTGSFRLDPASDASSPVRSRAPGQAHLVTAGAGPAAAVDRRRSSTSAIHRDPRARPRIVQTPPTTATVPRRSSGRASEPARDVKPFDLTPPWRVAIDVSGGRRSPSLLGGASLARAPLQPRPTETRRARGFAGRTRLGTSGRSLARSPRGLLPRSTRPGHLVSRARCETGRSRLSRGAPGEPRPPSRTRLDELAFARPPAGPPHPCSREGARGSAAPEVPSVARRPREAWPALHNLSPACGLPGTGAFLVRVRAGALTCPVRLRLGPWGLLSAS
jgi:hypothetical protein